MDMERRFRPTVGQVRDLERRLSEANEAHRLQVEENKHLLEEISYLNGRVSDLEKRLEEQIDGSSAVIQESNGWRSDYQELWRKYTGLLSRGDDVTDDDAKAEVNALRQSNSLMESELIVLRSNNNRLESECDGLRHEVKSLKSRSLWQRILNK